MWSLNQLNLDESVHPPDPPLLAIPSLLRGWERRGVGCSAKTTQTARREQAEAGTGDYAGVGVGGGSGEARERWELGLEV